MKKDIMYRKMFFINLFEVMQIVRTLGIDALVNNEMLAGKVLFLCLYISCK